MKKCLCDCGSSLRLVELVTYEHVTKVRKDGKLYKRRMKPYISHVQLQDNAGDTYFLQCWECDNKYECMGIIDNGEVVRGDKILS